MKAGFCRPIVVSALPAQTVGALRSCRVICQYGVGLDQIDLDAATAAGIVVSHTPDYCIQEVAEHTIALLFAVAGAIAQSFYVALPTTRPGA